LEDGEEYQAAAAKHDSDKLPDIGDPPIWFKDAS
jgi:hypothetical protein